MNQKKFNEFRTHINIQLPLRLRWCNELIKSSKFVTNIIENTIKHSWCHRVMNVILSITDKYIKIMSETNFHYNQIRCVRNENDLNN